jgi:hypothetical protein
MARLCSHTSAAALGRTVLEILLVFMRPGDTLVVTRIDLLEALSVLLLTPTGHRR